MSRPHAIPGSWGSGAHNRRLPALDLPAYNAAYRELAERRGLDAVQAARLIAMGNVVGADALIACFDAKYRYLFWRPVFAIPGWTPLLPTPPHPEYPSAHSCLTFSQAAVFKRFLGTRRIHVDLRSFPENPAMPVRHFTTTADLKREIVDARVWGCLLYTSPSPRDRS